MSEEAGGTVDHCSVVTFKTVREGHHMAIVLKIVKVLTYLIKNSLQWRYSQLSLSL